MNIRVIYLLLVYTILACILILLANRYAVCSRKATGAEYNGTNGGAVCLNCHGL